MFQNQQPYNSQQILRQTTRTSYQPRPLSLGAAHSPHTHTITHTHTQSTHTHYTHTQSTHTHNPHTHTHSTHTHRKASTLATKPLQHDAQTHPPAPALQAAHPPVRRRQWGVENIGGLAPQLVADRCSR